MQIMKSDAFFAAYVLCRSLMRGPEYIDAITDPKTYTSSGETLEASPPADMSEKENNE